MCLVVWTSVSRDCQNNVARHRQYRKGEGDVNRKEDGKTIISDCTGLKLSETLRMTENREQWKELVVRPSVSAATTRLRDR